MIKYFLQIIFLSLVIFFTTHSQAQQRANTVVQGIFCSAENGAAAPGLLVSIVHPELGRSAQAYTNEDGQFRIFNIPINRKPYFIEVYWGNRIIYRKQILVSGPLNLPRKCI